MTAQIRPVRRNMPMLLPPDLRDWIPEDDMVHFIIEAVDRMPLSLDDFHINHRGTGKKQYPPKMMLALLIYCYANGICASRRIERATYVNIAVRYLTADMHPDHDTICTFRRRNAKPIAVSFLHVLTLAKEMGFLKVGTVSVDGTHIKAHASKNKNVRYDRAQQLEKQLRADIDELIRQAEEADNSETDDGQKLPKEIKRRERLIEKMKQAKAELERRAEEKHQLELKKHQQKLDECESRQEDDVKRAGKKPKEPTEQGPKPTDQANMTDADSRLMRKNRRAGYTQSYNAQIAVDADGSQLILSQHVTNCASDAGELEPALEGIHPSIGRANIGLADHGYLNGDAIERLTAAGYDIYMPVTSADGNNERRYDFRPPKEPKQAKTIRDKRLLAMQEKMKTDEAKKRYKKRQQTVEPVFGIIKEAIGIRGFLLRGLEKVSLEWNLITLGYNMKRLFALISTAKC